MDRNAVLVTDERVLEFVASAADLCVYLESMELPLKEEFVDKMLMCLPVLYTKVKPLPRLSPVYDGEAERFVTEMEYSAIQHRVSSIFGSDDAYLEVFVEEMRYFDEPITAFISENIADIYQELRDLLGNWQIDDDGVKNDALIVCVEAFEQHWGQKLLNVLRPLHVLSMMKDIDPYEL